MSTSMYMSLLALFILSFSTSTTFANCPTGYSSMPLVQNYLNPNVSNINILFLRISNDLPHSWPDKLFFVGTEQGSPCYLYNGKPFAHVYSANLREYAIISGQRVIYAVIYDPKVDLAYHNVYWSVREDGAYKSYDNVNWTKHGSWGHE